jgi:2-oxoglutarate dehydrogenase E1 component
MSQIIQDSFRRWGYLQADLDPFDRLPKYAHRDIDSVSENDAKPWREKYCGKIGAEFMYMSYPERCDWVAAKMEGDRSHSLDPNFILRRLTSAKTLESFIHTKYIGNKRFSLEGLTALIPLLDSIITEAAENNFEYIYLGMAHRGRLNVLVHIAGTKPSAIFAGFEDIDAKSILGSGDVKYHKGANGNYITPKGKEIHIHLASNPSHLEAVNPVAMGRARARQTRIGDDEKKRVLVICLHGDAAFAGQGITAETLNFADLPGFRVGGTVHIIVNNLIGFTAKPRYYQSGRFSTDVAKRLEIPIFHVNSESLDDVAWCGETAMKYRCEFQSDVVIDLIGYRQYGHNEGDDPSITSPTLYTKLKDHPQLHESYAKQIGVTEPELKKIESEITDNLKAEHEIGAAATKQQSFYTLPSYWSNYCGGYYDSSFEVETAVPAERLAEIANLIVKTPNDFKLNPKLSRVLEQRLEMAVGKRPIDWGSAEALAFGSLLWEGTPVRIAGQDSRRGTFAHRHAVYYDYESGEQYIPLQNLHQNQATFDVYDSMLSEAAAVGFEYGFSRDYPEALVCWEAQFGDFANGAQTIIDQFIAAGEDKWTLLSGLVMLLPHGYEGQGPEHSSARIERFLQLAGEDNIQITYPSTAGQYFHLLRRQALRKWRKPLVVFTPKSMLRAKPACSELNYLTNGSFKTIITDSPEFNDASRLLVCGGKIVHELRAEREKEKHLDTAIISLEQFYPFPVDEVEQIIGSYRNLRSVVWVQEEPANMGALFFVRPYLEQIFGKKNITTVRRSTSGSPATGSPKGHAMEQEAILKLAFAKYS